MNIASYYVIVLLKFNIFFILYIMQTKRNLLIFYTLCNKQQAVENFHSFELMSNVEY